jgi:hypothetical protein
MLYNVLGDFIMAFDISKLTSAVNKYLYSISDVSAAAKKAQEEIEAKNRFSTELSDAIKQNIASRMRDQTEVPDVSEAVKNQVQQAVGTIDATFEQLNGAFNDMRNAGRVTQTAEAARATDAVTNANAKAKSTGTDLQNAVNTVLSAAGTAEEKAQLQEAIDKVIASASSNRTGNAGNGNFDAYKGTLSTEALQELSKSQYFSANLIQGYLFNEDGKSEESDDSLSSLNTNSLLAGGTESVAGTSSEASDLAKALIKAYAGSSASPATTSIFGDFTL